MSHTSEFAHLLSYPRPDHLARVGALRAAVAPVSAAAAQAIDRHLERVAGLTADAIEELYTRTFDLQPATAPYLSVHLFGEESFQRAGLMTGLAAAWQRLGRSSGQELPDHVAVVLRHGPHLPGDEWVELARFALVPSLLAMTTSLEAAKSPYAALCDAACHLVCAELGLVPNLAAAPAPQPCTAACSASCGPTERAHA